MERYFISYVLHYHMGFKAITITETLLQQCHDGIAIPTPGKHLVEIYSHFNIVPPKVLHIPCDRSTWSRYLSPALAELILFGNTVPFSVHDML